MYYYLILKNNKTNDSLNSEILFTLNSYYTKVEKHFSLDSNTTIYIVKGLDNKELLEEYFITLFNEHATKSLVYISANKNSIIDFEDEMIVINEYLESIFDITKLFVINFSTLISLIYQTNFNSNLKRLVLVDFYNNQVMIETLTSFFENNLNVLKTSKKLNIHRNTLNYRLNSFYEKTNLDPRNFNDAVIIKLML